MELIQGLHIDVPGSEMKTLFEGRLKYHQEKADALGRQIEQFRKLDKALAEEADNIGKVSNSSPAQSLEQSAKKHRDQTVYYRFMVDHVVMGATYRLSQSELQTLGIMPNPYG
jgi:hypothetical protein